MDYMFLPDCVKNYLDENFTDKTPICTIRGSGGFNNTSGESYVILFENNILMLERSFGNTDFEYNNYTLSEVEDIEVTKENFNSEMNISVKFQSFQVKISLSEYDNCQTIEHAVKHDEETSEEPIFTKFESDPGRVELSPLIAFVTSLMFVAAEDGDIDERENELIYKLCSNNQDVYDAALQYYNDYDFDEILNRVALSEQQKLCYYANMLELAMCDGVLSSKEQKLLNHFAEEVAIPEKHVKAIWNVLMVKDQLSILV